MFKDGKYRYSLGFGNGTEKERRAGELLERLGNRKSSLIVDVLSEYIDKHPELENSQGKIEITITTSPSAPSKEKIEQMVRELVAETISSMQINCNVPTASESIDSYALDKNIAIMLDNLDQF